MGCRPRAWNSIVFFGEDCATVIAAASPGSVSAGGTAEDHEIHGDVLRTRRSLDRESRPLFAAERGDFFSWFRGSRRFLPPAMARAARAWLL